MRDVTFEMLLRHRVSIRRPTRVRDDLGGERLQFTTIATNVPALVQGLPIRQAELGKYRMWVTFDTDIKERDRVDYNGEEYEVIFIDDAGGQGHHLECDLDEISGTT